MKVAVLLLTFDRIKLLRKCVESIKAQENYNFEIKLFILVNGPDLEAKEYVESLMSELDVELIYKDIGLPVGEARNELIYKIQEEWICFLDDDIYLDKDYFQNAQNFLNEYKEIEIFGGPDSNTDTANNFQETLSLVMENFFATGPTNKRHKSFGNSILDGDEVNLILCNFWAKRSVFNLKMFPVKFRRNEENYLLAILKDMGIRMKYVPFLKVHHNRKVNYYKIIRVLYLAGVYRSVSIIFYPKSSQLIFFLHLIFLAIIIGSFTIDIRFGLGIISSYLSLIIIQSAIIANKTKKPFSFARAIILFFIFNFTYPLGQIYGYFKGIALKLKGSEF